MVSLQAADIAIIITINGALSYLISEWYKASITQAIKHEYDLKMEDYKFEIKRREQAAKIAELFSIIYSNSKQIDIAKANQIVWELSLWLPENILKELPGALNKEKGSKDPKEILIEIRKILINNMDDKLKSEQIIHF